MKRLEARKKELSEKKKAIFKSRIVDAKSHFPYKHVLTDKRKKTEIKTWLRTHHFRSWKQKGLNAQFYTEDHVTYWFRTEEDRFQFIMFVD